MVPVLGPWEASWGLVFSPDQLKSRGGAPWSSRLSPLGSLELRARWGGVGGGDRVGREGGAAARALFLKALWRTAMRGPAGGGRRGIFTAPPPETRDPLIS